MKRGIAIAAVMVCLGGAAASAQTASESSPAGHQPSLSIGSLSERTEHNVWRGANIWDANTPQMPVGTLNTLYVTTALMQALDFHSTRVALRAGGIEANPIMARIAANPYLFATTKGAVAASTILLTRQIAKRNRLAAVLTLTAINSAYAMVVRSNYQVAGMR